MNRQSLSLEQTLLTLSGLIAIGLVAWLSYIPARGGAHLATHGLFMLLFLTAALDQELRLPALYGKVAMPALVLVALAALAGTRDTISLILLVVLAAQAPYHLTGRQSWLLLLAGNLLSWLILQSQANAGSYLGAWLTLATLQGFAISSSLARRRDNLSQEAFHNAIRHGGADRISIRYDQRAFTIDDNGRGLDGGRPVAGFGLRNIEKRLAAFGGSAQLRANPETSGCRLTLRLPEGIGT